MTSHGGLATSDDATDVVEHGFDGEMRNGFVFHAGEVVGHPWVRFLLPGVYGFIARLIGNGDCPSTTRSILNAHRRV
jgi:hypothetical protein